MSSSALHLLNSATINISLFIAFYEVSYKDKTINTSKYFADHHHVAVIGNLLIMANIMITCHCMESQFS